MTDKERIDYLEAVILEMTGKLINTQTLIQVQNESFVNILKMINPEFEAEYNKDRIRLFNEVRPSYIGRYKHLSKDARLLLSSMQLKDFDAL